MLLNFNPYTITSDPGQGLADEALVVLMGGQEHHDLSLVCDSSFVLDVTDVVIYLG